MGLLTPLKEVLDAGDPILMAWPLVSEYWLPFVFSLMYVLFVKRLGPSFMKYRKPFELRKPMIVYNLCVVAVYVSCLSVLIYSFFTTDAYKALCNDIVVIKNHYTYYCTSAAWFLYVLKYVEYTDTIFFILRKKDHLVTNLHVVHHAILPILCWFMLRTEKSGFQFITAFINSCVHIIMYTYYGLAAMGPEVRKKLWWKEYLTRLQMAQFVVILLLQFVFLPLSGCRSTKHGVFVVSFLAALFLGLFYNFYQKTYRRQASGHVSSGVNGVHKSSGVSSKNE